MVVEMLQQHSFNFIVLARPGSKNRILRQNVMIKQFKLVEVRQNLIISPNVPPASLLAQLPPIAMQKGADVIGDENKTFEELGWNMAKERLPDQVNRQIQLRLRHSKATLIA